MKTIKLLIPISLLIVTLLPSSCKDKAGLPKVTTTPFTEVTWEYAIAGGEVTDDGGSPIIARGVCFTTNEKGLPTIIDDENTHHTIDDSGMGAFTSKILYDHWGADERISYTNHYVRAYATNKEGTAYGKVLICFPKLKPPKFNSITLVSTTSTSATIKWELSLIETSVDEIDLCYSTSSNPTIEGDHLLIADKNSSQGSLINLTPNTTYYVRGYAKNESGFAYSTEVSFTTWEGSVTDAAGIIYPYKTIGSQVWFTKNLETTKFNDGSIIPVVSEDLLWANTTTSASCKYSDFGKLYNYYAVVDSKKLCPAGWHIPSDSDWKTLEMFLGMSQDQADATGLRGTNEGGKIKYLGISIYDGWNFPNTGATNSFGFSARGGGYRSENGISTNENISANFWTSSEFDANSAWGRTLSYNNAQIARLNIKKGCGLSIRCVKD